MKKLKTSGSPPSFDREGSGDYDPDEILADKDGAVAGTCEICGEKLVPAGEGWTCPNCNQVMEQDEEESYV
jgi:hypothetical protein